MTPKRLRGCWRAAPSMGSLLWPHSTLSVPIKEVTCTRLCSEVSLQLWLHGKKLTQLHLGQCRGKGLCPCKKITTANTKWEVAQLYVFKWFQLQVSVVQKSACSLCGFLQLNLCYVQSVKWTWLRGAYSNTLFMLAAVRTLLVSMHIHVVLQGSMHPSHVTTLS